MKGRLIVQIQSPEMTIEFPQSLRTCTVRLGAAVFENIPIHRINLRDWEDPQWLYLFKVPCKASLGKDYMVAVGNDAVYGYNHPERQPLIFHELTHDEHGKLVQLDLFGEVE